MKSIKKYVALLLGAALVAPMFTACGGSDEPTPEEPVKEPTSLFNTQIHFVSALDDGTLVGSSSDYTALSEYMVTTLEAGAKSWITVLDRMDGNNQAQALTLALESERWSLFALNRVVGGSSFEGSYIYYNDFVIEGSPQQYVSYQMSDNSFVTGFSPLMKGTQTSRDGDGNVTGVVDLSFNVHFRTARLESADQITSFVSSSVDGMSTDNRNFVMVGTVRNSLVSQLQSALTSQGKVELTTIESGSEFSLVLVADSDFWALTSVEASDITSSIKAYTINLKW